MTISNLTDLRRTLPPGQRLIGIDPGKKTIGLALSDVSLLIATPMGALKRGKMAANAAELAKMIYKLNIGGLVVGLPLSMDGTMGPAAQAARDWARDIADLLEVPVAMWDERLSSAAVNRFLIDEADMSRGRRAEVVDSMAAAYMLQSALDATQT